VSRSEKKGKGKSGKVLHGFAGRAKSVLSVVRELVIDGDEGASFDG
jgi:hypothetical protein